MKLETKAAKSLPIVYVDGDMIRRVLINLIENAITYSKKGKGVLVGAKREDKFVEVWVEDQGIGIAKAEQERIFDKFTKSQKDSTARSKGLGLGLAYCKLAVEGHGGRIWVESTRGKGARFIFTLPIA